jgi:hypothetical protein
MFVELSLPINGDGFLAFFESDFDESGKFKDHRVVSFCRVMASPESLKSFNEVWDALLRRNEMTFLHTTHALRCSRSVSPVIREQSPSERCESLKPFVECILDNLDLGVGIALDVRGFSKWEPKAKKRVGGSDDPAYLAFMQGTLALKVYACRDDDRISMMCDDDTETAWNFYQLYRQMQKIDPELRKKLVALSFANDESFPALQAADLIAGLMRMESIKRFGYHAHEFSPLVSSLMEPKPSQKLKWIAYIGDNQRMDEMWLQMQTAKIRR